MTNIEWTDETWNPVVGCTPVSPGCLNCYAATMALRLEAMGRPEYAPQFIDLQGTRHRGAISFGDRAKTIRIAEVRGGRAVFTGEVRTLEHRLTDPLHWRTPRRVFVNSMSDLFHEDVPFEFVDQVFAVMALCPQHTFQVLTKRPERMAEYLDRSWVNMADGRRGLRDGINAAAFELTVGRHVFPTHEHGMIDGPSWPLPNVWLGASVERQEEADERIPHLLRCPAAVRFLSCEPLLGPVDLGNIRGRARVTNALTGHVEESDTIDGGAVVGRGPGIDWVIVGGESGGKARACDVEWIRGVVRQCKAAGVPCFVKQLGSACEMRFGEWNELTGGGSTGSPRFTLLFEGADRGYWKLEDRKGGDPAEWPEDLRVREMPEVKP